MKRGYIGYSLCLVLWFVWMACTNTPAPAPPKPTLQATPYKTKHVILVVIDGVRYTESWGEPDRKHIPQMATSLAPQGTLFTNFRNQGLTYTVAGHTALLTGFYLNMDNYGVSAPTKPSYLQIWRDAALAPKEKAWIVSGKAHLDILTKCKDDKWRGRAEPSEDCGAERNGFKVYLRDDDATFKALHKVLKEHKPSLAVVALPDTDVIGHERAKTPEKQQDRWERYLASIRANDRRVGELWKMLQQDPFYKDKTALLVTHDHGRHVDGRQQIYFNHGDDCEGCRRISLLALGPDFKPGHVVTKQASQIDVAPTIGHLLGFKVPGTKGRVLKEMLR